jgi:cytochrome c
MIQDRLGAHLRTQYTIRPWKRSITVSRLMKMAIVSGTTLVTTIAALSGSAGAQADSASIRAGRQLADTQCAQCHGVDRKAQSTNPAAPAFEDVANVPGMTATRVDGRAADFASVDAKHHRSGPRCGKYHRIYPESEANAMIRTGVRSAIERLAMSQLVAERRHHRVLEIPRRSGNSRRMRLDAFLPGPLPVEARELCQHPAEPVVKMLRRPPCS